MQPAIAQVEAYWHGLCQNGSIPARADIDPRGIRSALDHAFIIERISPGLARFRLAGAHLGDLMGMEVRGMPLTSFFEPSAREDVSEQLIRLFEAPEIVHMHLVSPSSMGRAPMTASLVLLPLRSDLGDVSRAIGCMVASGGVGRTPRRFVIDSVRSMPAIATATDPVSTPANTQTPAAGFAEDAAPFKPKDPDTRPHLRLIKSDK